MPIESELPKKTCRFCGKSFVNMSHHIINAHPSIIEQLEEKESTTTTPPMPSNAPHTPLNSINPVALTTREMIREKMEMMLDIQIMRMLEKNPDIPISELHKAINPAPNTSIKDIIDLHNSLYPRGGGTVPAIAEETDNSGKWLDLATAALPMIGGMLANRNKNIEEENKNVAEYRTTENGDLSTIKPISEQIAGDTEQPNSISEESRIILPTKQKDN